MIFNDLKLEKQANPVKSPMQNVNFLLVLEGLVLGKAFGGSSVKTIQNGSKTGPETVFFGSKEFIIFFQNIERFS